MDDFRSSDDSLAGVQFHRFSFRSSIVQDAEEILCTMEKISKMGGFVDSRRQWSEIRDQKRQLVAVFGSHPSHKRRGKGENQISRMLQPPGNH
jgi:hypothetical protein